MTKLRVFTIAVLFALGVFGAPALAQSEAAPSEPQRVEITATDGLVLVGDFYASAADQPQPALLLMHMNGGRRQDWQAWILLLHAAGYNILTVDLRGHGDSADPTNWTTAQGDTQEWLVWLTAQPTVLPDQIGIIGASIGSNLALVGCAAADACRTVIALSPGLDYFGVQPQASVEGMGRRGVLLVAEQMDRESAEAVLALNDAASIRTPHGLVVFPGSAHGTEMISRRPALTALVADWLAERLPVGQ